MKRLSGQLETHFRYCLVLAGCFLVFGCSTQSKPDLIGTPSLADETPDGPDWFEDITDRSGIHFIHDAGPTGSYPMPQSMGSGCALFDFDGDGLLDIYLVQNAGPKSSSTNCLLHQKGDGTFEDVSVGSGLDIAGYGMGVAIGDINNDGRSDVLVTQVEGARLFLNLGNGKFADVTKEAGVNNPYWSSSAAFFDYDGDGWLDLVIVNYIDYEPSLICYGANGARDFCSPKSYTPTQLFHNRGGELAKSSKSSSPRVGFEDVTSVAGLSKTPGPGLGVICADFDGDGRPDIFVANDGQPNRLWINSPQHRFTNEAATRGVAYCYSGAAFSGMGVAIGDIDRDGLLDLYVTHLTAETNTLWKQGPRGLFKDATVATGLTTTRWRGTGFGTLMADFDQDGWLDIAVVNGRVLRGAVHAGPGVSGFWEPYAERNQIFTGTPEGKFRDRSVNNKAFCGHFNVARGLACGDVDNDGAVDLLVTTIGDRARLYRNIAPQRGHWLKVCTIDPVGNRDALGAEITLFQGSSKIVRLVHPSDSYLSSSSPIAHFGLAAATQVDRIEVVWADGTRQTFPGYGADQTIELRKSAHK